MKSKRYVAFAMVMLLCLSFAGLAFAGTITEKISGHGGIAVINGYTSGGLGKTVTFKVTGNPNCHYRCFMTTPNGNYVEIGGVKGDGSQTASKYFLTLAGGTAFFDIMPYSGSVSGQTVSVTITVP